MSERRGGLRPYLELARISNLPTVFSNVLVGVAIGSGARSVPIDPVLATLLCLGAGLLYTGGMILNDAADAPFDREHNPGRPIPSGRISRRAATIIGSVALAGGMAGIIGGAAMTGHHVAAAGWTGALAATIVVYDLVHKRFAASVLLMGACRGLVYLACAAAVDPGFDRTIAFTIAGVMTAYIVVVTALARREHVASAVSRPAAAFPIVSLALPGLILVPAIATAPREIAWPEIAAAVLAVTWLIRCAIVATRDPARTRDAVMGWLAGICLADGYYLILLDRPVLAAVAAGLFIVTVLGHRRIEGS